jgi:beta-glucosidase
MLRLLIWLMGATIAASRFSPDYSQYDTSPPVYPSRESRDNRTVVGTSVLTQPLAQITGLGGWNEALEKAQAFVAQLTLEEKASMVTGTSRRLAAFADRFHSTSRQALTVSTAQEA